MAYVSSNIGNTGSFVPSTNIWDVSALYEVDVNSPEFKELLIRLYQNVNLIALSLNSKDTAYYVQSEINTSQLYYNTTSLDTLNLRQGFRISIDTGALGAGVTSINHELPVTSDWKWMFISGAATDTGNILGYPIPYAGPSGNNISVNVTATQVVINNQSGVVFTNGTVTLVYVKD